jgi:signal transduction histidine kinase
MQPPSFTEQERQPDAVSDVCAGIARELRTPVLGITSAAQLLRFRVKDDPVIEKNVGRILREVERLNGLVSALQEYSRPEPLHLVTGDPDAVWDEVLQNQRGRLESRALLLHRHRPETATHCALDAGQLAQAFVQLLANAAEAAPEGTDLTLESTVLPDHAWQCRLHNGGPSIPSDVLPRVFEMFFSTRPGATGLGLPLCRRIVEAHEGSISLESDAEHGTTATLVLPIVTRGVARAML